MIVKSLILFTILTVTSASAQDIGTLTRANPCTVTPFHFDIGGSAASTMSMKNDGAWCWASSTYSRNNQHMSAHYVTQSVAPKHGTILIGDMPNFGVRVAYQPAKNFVGTDTFMIHYGVADANVSFVVNVQ